MYYITSFSPGEASGQLFGRLEESPRVIIKMVHGEKYSERESIINYLLEDLIMRVGENPLPDKIELNEGRFDGESPI